MQMLWNWLITLGGYFFVLAIVCHFLLKWERQVLNRRLEVIRASLKGLSNAEAEVLLCRPENNRIIKMIEVRDRVPKDKRYSQRILVQKAVNEAFSQVTLE